MLGPLKSIADYIDPADDSASATHHAEARRQIEKMIDKVTGRGRRFVLFVDDLERSPERTLEVLDILDSLFSTPRCIVVIPTDLELLGRALERHSNVRDGRRYLEKYVQLQFDMPSVEKQSRILVYYRHDLRPELLQGDPSTKMFRSKRRHGIQQVALKKDKDIEPDMVADALCGPNIASGQGYRQLQCRLVEFCFGERTLFTFVDQTIPSGRRHDGHGIRDGAGNPGHADLSIYPVTCSCDRLVAKRHLCTLQAGTGGRIAPKELKKTNVLPLSYSGLTVRNREVVLRR
jgi:hypothetical protein